MTPYVDGFVIPVPKDKLEVYRRTAEKAAKIWKEHGCIDYRECVGDDLAAEGMRSFTDLAAASADDVVVFAYAVYESKEARDKANAAIMADPRMADMMKESAAIFDFARMACGGFREIVRG